MLGDPLTEALPVVGFLHLVQKQVRAILAGPRNLAPVFLDNIVEKGRRCGAKTVVGEVEVEHIIARNTLIEQVFHKLECVEGLSAASDSRDDVHEVEEGGFGERPHDARALVRGRQLERTCLLDEGGVVLLRWCHVRSFAWAGLSASLELLVFQEKSAL